MTAEQIKDVGLIEMLDAGGMHGYLDLQVLHQGR
jgi:hypothetical protein